jgi:succinate dehydrogenase/fumarate reductase flavoprotein subunit
VSGGGATALNLILGKTNAFIEDSVVTATGGVGQGEVHLEAYNSSGIDAWCRRARCRARSGSAGRVRRWRSASRWRAT